MYISWFAAHGRPHRFVHILSLLYFWIHTWWIFRQTGRVCTESATEVLRSATEWTASVHTLRIQTCDSVRVISATEWTASIHASHMFKPVIAFVFKCYGMDCFSSYITHVQTCDNLRVQSATRTTSSPYFTHVQTCGNVRVQRTMTSSVHTWHMCKPVRTFVFKPLWNGRLQNVDSHTHPKVQWLLYQWVWRQHETEGLDPESFLQKRRTQFWSAGNFGKGCFSSTYMVLPCPEVQITCILQHTCI